MVNDARKCEQCKDTTAECYGGGPYAGDWAGHYCYPCIESLGFQIWDRYGLDAQARAN